MPTSTEPTVLLSSLYRADGSATFAQNGYSVIGSVNGPIEVLRRDELPEEAAVEVIIRPANGVAGMLLRFICPLAKLTRLQAHGNDILNPSCSLPYGKSYSFTTFLEPLFKSPCSS